MEMWPPKMSIYEAAITYRLIAGGKADNPVPEDICKRIVDEFGKGNVEALIDASQQIGKGTILYIGNYRRVGGRSPSYVEAYTREILSGCLRGTNVTYKLIGTHLFLGLKG